MRSGNYEYQSEFARKYVAQGREEGRQEGRQEGLKEGREQGRQQAEVQTLLQSLLDVLETRNLTADEQAWQRIQACTDPAQLKSWLRKAVTVSSVQSLFETQHGP